VIEILKEKDLEILEEPLGQRLHLMIPEEASEADFKKDFHTFIFSKPNTLTNRNLFYNPLENKIYVVPAGFMHKQKQIARIVTESKFKKSQTKLINRPLNKFDPHCILITQKLNAELVPLGFIPRSINKDVAKSNLFPKLIFIKQTNNFFIPLVTLTFSDNLEVLKDNLVTKEISTIGPKIDKVFEEV